MTLSTILNALLLLALIVWLGYRQSTWRPIRSGRMWRMPILLGIAGVVVLAQTVDRITTLDVIALTVEAAISLGVGAAMGRIARIRPIAQPSVRTEGASLESRTGWWGMALWLIVIVSRVGIDLAAAANGAFVAEYGVVLPRRLQIDFSRHVQQHTDATGEEVTAEALWALFSDVYLHDPQHPSIGLEAVHIDEGNATTEVIVRVDDQVQRSTHAGPGPVEAAVRALAGCGIDLAILSLHQSSLTTGADAEAVTLIEYRDADGPAWVAGRDRSTLAATLQAVARAADRVSAHRRVTAAVL